jgi:SAM-dependent methyltransferase
MTHRVTFAALFDEEIRRHYELFRAAADIGVEDRVLDIGCGTGESTRDAARTAENGTVLAVDISEPLLQLAGELGADLTNVTYVLADAQTHPFPPAHFDVCISRFGTMFFQDPVAAFGNIGRALRPDGRLVLLVWQPRERNEWEMAIRDVLGSVPPTAGADAFSLGDPSTVEGILRGAGFGAVTFTEVHEPVYYGPEVDTACELVLGLSEPRQLLAQSDDAAGALARLRALIAAHETTNGVFFDSRAWIITAGRVT